MPWIRVGSPPHARGIQAEAEPLVINTGDHPRMRGEYMCGAINELTFVGSPPHARGIRHSCSTRSLWTGITPACAGNTELEALRDLDARDHPRMRGEYSFGGYMINPKEGSPPHARGIQQSHSIEPINLGITPASAGNTLQCFLPQQPGRDHPRMRGEYVCFLSSAHAVEGSPPHARGIQPFHKFCIYNLGITPACAGNTSMRSTQTW